jgi:hypothetical protein
MSLFKKTMKPKEEPVIEEKTSVISAIDGKKKEEEVTPKPEDELKIQTFAYYNQLDVIIANSMNEIIEQLISMNKELVALRETITRLSQN